jgi:RHS repeat-associated protein
MSPAGDVSVIQDGGATLGFTYDFRDRVVAFSPGYGSAADLVHRYAISNVYTANQITDRIKRSDELTASGSVLKYAYDYDWQTNISSIGAYAPNLSYVAVCLRHDPLGRLTIAGGGPNNFGDSITCAKDADVTPVTARFKYDARGRRVARWLAATGQWTYLVHGPSGELLSEIVPTGDPANPWAPVRDYVWLDGRPLVQLEYNGATSAPRAYYFHVDHLGTPRKLTSAEGATVWSAVVQPYGDITETKTPDPVTGQTVVTNLRLPGQYDERLLGSVGLQGPYYNWNRWYLPSVGRYLELDPIALRGRFNGAFGPDWYNYANGNPLRYTDPWGLETYRCRKPLDALGGDGTRSGPDVRGNPFYHQYSCVVRNGNVQCGGQDLSGSPWGSPGKPSDDKFNPDTCKQAQPDNDCYEKCLAEEWAKPRPWYGIPFGTDCQEYDDNVNETCRKRCNIK